jgi:hypothetical protein
MFGEETVHYRHRTCQDECVVSEGSEHSLKTKHISIVDLPWQPYIATYATTGELSEKFFDALVRLVWSQARRLPQFLYSPTHSWNQERLFAKTLNSSWKNADDSCKTIVCNLLTNHVNKGHFERLYHGRKTNRQIYVHLKLAVKWQLRDVAKKHGAVRRALYNEIASVLQHDLRFRHFPSIKSWGFAEWNTQELEPISDERLRDRIEFTSVPCPCSFRKEKKFIPSEFEIVSFLTLFIAKVGYPLSLKALAEAAFVHFDIFDPHVEAWPQVRDKMSGEDQDYLEFPDPLPIVDEADIRNQFEHLLGKMNSDDLYLMKRRFIEGVTLTELAGPGYEKSSVGNDIQRLAAMLKRLDLDDTQMTVAEIIFRETLWRLL